MFPSVWLSAFAYFGLAIVSAVLPWVNAELLMISAVPLAGSRSALAALVIAVAAGQMTGKTLMYWASRRSMHPRSPLMQRGIDRWRVRLRRRPHSAVVIIFVSALLGVPPFFIVSVAAGALGVEFSRFLVAGSVGRLVHFTVVAYVPDILWRTS
jgi:membrane protein YqaA with SNARE-associated domain